MKSVPNRSMFPGPVSGLAFLSSAWVHYLEYLIRNKHSLILFFSNRISELTNTATKN